MPAVADPGGAGQVSQVFQRKRHESGSVVRALQNAQSGSSESLRGGKAKSMLNVPG